jgi:molecular chaperone HscB
MPPFGADKNYFELFGLAATFDIDVADLASRYRRLARETHPDRYAGGSDQERRVAAQATALLNEAYRTLKEPIERASYLLALQGVTVGGETDTAMNPVFLAEQIELRERLDEVRHAGDAVAHLARLTEDVARRIEETRIRLRECLAQAESQQARQLVREMQFLDKLRRQIGDVEETLTS